MSEINVIGAACMDILLYPVDRESFFSGKYKTDHIRMYPGGDALNEALILGHFKADTKLIAILGDDLPGKQLLAIMEAGNVSHREDILRREIETYLSIVCVSQDGERTFVGNKDGSLRKLQPEDIAIDDDCRIVSFASLFISEYLNDLQLEELFSQIKRKGKILCVDSSTPKHNETLEDMRSLRHADYFFCNKSEAASLTGTDDVEEMAKRFADCGVNVIIKCGRDGAYHQGRFYETEPILPIDTTGAGDSFVAGFILALSQGKNIDDCLRSANRFGQRACRYLGATEWIKYE